MLQHHFDSLEQQQETSTLGMWIFLVTEVLFFGGMFFAYVIYRMWYPDAWLAASGHQRLDGYREAMLGFVLPLTVLTVALIAWRSWVEDGAPSR